MSDSPNPIRILKVDGKRLLPVVLRQLLVACIFLVVLFTSNCHNASRNISGVTLTLIDQSWAVKDFQYRLHEELGQFTAQTGIQVQVLPAPEAAIEQLSMWRKLLEGGAKVPDVYGVDVIWPGILADNLVDLKAYVPTQEMAAYFPQLIANDTVNGRLVALPTNLDAGLLFYRSDLLREYGYRNPPKTWQELQSMAMRIQVGERAKGNKDFWGFVWQGAPSEALTCNALEWQVSEGGGTILDESGRVIVNNRQTIRAWDRAARWVGSISPPGVIAYKEWDALNVWQAGKAAFMRNWTSAYLAAAAQNSPTKDRFDIAPLPRGEGGIAATIGGDGYAVSRHSRYPQEAAMLVRFLSGRDEQIRRSRNSALAPTMPQLYNDANLLSANPQFSRVLQVYREGVALRPSAQTGKMYPDVSRAYFEAVHDVLTRKKTAAVAAAELEQELLKMLKAPSSDATARPYQYNGKPRE